MIFLGRPTVCFTPITPLCFCQSKCSVEIFYSTYYMLMIQKIFFAPVCRILGEVKAYGMGFSVDYSSEICNDVNVFTIALHCRMFKVAMVMFFSAWLMSYPCAPGEEEHFLQGRALFHNSAKPGDENISCAPEVCNRMLPFFLLVKTASRGRVRGGLSLARFLIIREAGTQARNKTPRPPAMPSTRSQGGGFYSLVLRVTFQTLEKS